MLQLQRSFAENISVYTQDYVQSFTCEFSPNLFIELNPTWDFLKYVRRSLLYNNTIPNTNRYDRIQ